MAQQNFTSPFTGDVVQPTDVSLSRIPLAAGTTTLVWSTYVTPPTTPQTYAASRVIELTSITAGTDTILRLPPAAQGSLGTDILLVPPKNNTIPFSVYDSTGLVNLGTVMSPTYFYLDSSVDGVVGSPAWGSFQYGVNSATAIGYSDGYGVWVDSAAHLNTRLTVTNGPSGGPIAASTLATYRAQLLVYSGASSAIWTLPSVSDLYAISPNWYAYIRNTTNDTLTIATSGSDKIDGTTSISLSAGESTIIAASTTTNYYSIGRGRSAVFAFTNQTISLSSAATTVPPGATILTFVGAATGAGQTVSLPAVTAVYYVHNLTSNNATLQLTTPATNTPIPLTAGQANIIVCDGTNLFLATPQLQGGSVSLTLNGGSQTGPSLNFDGDASLGLWHQNTGIMTVVDNGQQIGSFVGTGTTGGVFNGQAGFYATSLNAALPQFLKGDIFWGGTF